MANGEQIEILVAQGIKEQVVSENIFADTGVFAEALGKARGGSQSLHASRLAGEQIVAEPRELLEARNDLAAKLDNQRLERLRAFVLFEIKPDSIEIGVEAAGSDGYRLRLFFSCFFQRSATGIVRPASTSSHPASASASRVR